MFSEAFQLAMDAHGRAKREGFADASAPVAANLIVSLIGLLLDLLVFAIFARFLWNNAIVKLTSVASPAKSVWPLIGLWWLLRILS